MLLRMTHVNVRPFQCVFNIGEYNYETLKLNDLTVKAHTAVIKVIGSVLKIYHHPPSSLLLFILAYGNHQVVFA